MDTLELKPYIEQKLEALNKETDMNEVVNKGQLSFGLTGKEYRHLPSWNELLKSKKKLVRVFWRNCFITSFTVVGLTYSFGDRFHDNWVKDVISWAVISLVATLLYVVSHYFSLFYQFRKTEHAVRKLIYEDILDKINKNEAHLM